MCVYIYIYIYIYICIQAPDYIRLYIQAIKGLYIQAIQDIHTYLYSRLHPALYSYSSSPSDPPDDIPERAWRITIEII